MENVRYSSYRYLIFALLLIVFTPIGCWDRRELDNTAIVAGIALDKNDTGKSFEITLQVIDVRAIASQKQPAIDGEPYWNVTVTGDTVYEAVRRMNDITPNRLFLGHNQVLIFGEALARDGLEEYLDYFLRHREFRGTTFVLVSEGKARDVLNIKTRLERISAINVANLIRNRVANSQNSGVDLNEWNQRVSSPTTAPIAGMIHPINSGTESAPILAGTAVFDKNLKLISKLDAVETRGMLWMLDEVKSGAVKIKYPQQGDIDATLEIIESSSKIEPQISNGKLKIIIKISEVGNLKETTGPVPVLSPDIWNSMNRRQAEAIRNEVLTAVDKARKINADIIGFGDAVYKKYPHEWKAMEAQWDEIFPSLEVEVMVDSQLQLSGMTFESFE